MYEYNFLKDKEGVSDNYIPESEFSANINWVDANLKSLGYTMIAIDGWGDVSQLNENGYRTSHSKHWVHDYEWWSNYLQGKGMTLGMYGNPLWININPADTTTLIKGTTIPVSTLIDTSEHAHFTWIQVERPGAEEYVKGYIRYYAAMGIKYFRVDFLSWYESGQDRYLGTVGPSRPHEDYVTALRWMREAADSCGMFLSLVMPNLFNEAEVEQQYGHMIRVDEDVAEGQWLRWSDNVRGVKRVGWSVYANAFDGLTYWSYIAGRNKMILDPDFLRINTFANTDEKKSVISAALLAGGPVEIADEYNTIGNDLWVYSNTEMLALNQDGFVGKPLSNDPTQQQSQIWTGQMSNGDWIVGLFNRESSAQTRSVNFSTLGISGNGKVRDLWAHRNLGTMQSYSASVPPHGCIVLKVVPESETLSGPGAMHVGSLVTGTQSVGGGAVRGTATVLINDGNGTPVTGALVTVTFSASFTETVSGTTGSDGSVALVTSGTATGTVKVNACVRNVSRDSMNYAADQNVTTCVGLSMYLGATFNSWKLAPMIYQTGAWRFDSTIIPAGTQQLKFANTDDWSGDDWGDASGLTGTARLSTGGKPNITFNLSQRGLYDISFDDVSLSYSIVVSPIKKLNAAMNVAGTFSGWSLLPMTFENNGWKLDSIQMNAGAQELKFANTNNWSGDDWGNAAGLSGIAQLTTGGKPVITFTIPAQGSYSISFNDISLLYSIASNLTTSSINLRKGWNMISLPIRPVDNRKTILYPMAASNAFRYDTSGYAMSESLYVGTGYWMKFPADSLFSLQGFRVSGDSISVRAGWNMIGCAFDSVNVAGIETLPAGIVQSSYYGYDSGYTSAAILLKGKSYWVKVSVPGTIILK